MDYSVRGTNFALSLKRLGRRLDRRFVIILFTDFSNHNRRIDVRVTGRWRRDTSSGGRSSGCRA